MASLLLANPRKRRGAKRRKSVAKRKSPARRLATTTTVKRYRRNPARRSAGIMDTVQKGAIGAAGALAVDVAMQKLPIPANLSTGQLAPITRGVVGVGIGMLVAKLGKNKKLGTQLADGALTVALYNTGKDMIGPTLGLSGDGLLGNDDGLLYYGDDDGMGWSSAAPTYSGESAYNNF